MYDEIITLLQNKITNGYKNLSIKEFAFILENLVAMTDCRIQKSEYEKALSNALETYDIKH